MQIRPGEITDPAQAVGDLMVGVATGYQRLGIGTNGQVLKSNGTTASWQADLTNLPDIRDVITGQTITGTDTALPALSSTPSAGCIPKVYLNGLLQLNGAGNDYTISGNTITWLASSGTGIDIIASDTFIVDYY